MSRRTTKLYLQDILTAIQDIEEYSINLSYDTFCNDKKTIAAVVRNLEIIGEAARNMTQDMQRQHKTVPWRKMVSMRNKVLHEYFGVDTEILWKTIKEDLPELAKQIKSIT